MEFKAELLLLGDNGGNRFASGVSTEWQLGFAPFFGVQGSDTVEKG